MNPKPLQDTRSKDLAVNLDASAGVTKSCEVRTGHNMIAANSCQSNIDP